MFGSGGSCSLSGANAIGQNSGLKDCHHITRGTQLEHIKENQAMMMLAKTDAPVLVMFNMCDFLNTPRCVPSKEAQGRMLDD
jgi:hypothetical protein